MKKTLVAPTLGETILLRHRHSPGVRVSISYGADDSSIETTFSNREILAASSLLYQSLQNLGLKSGDTLAIVADSSEKWLILIAALTSMKVVFVPIFKTLPIRDIESIVEKSKATFLFTDSPELLDHFAKRSNFNVIYDVPLNRPTSEPSLPQVHFWKDLIRNRDEESSTDFESALLDGKPDGILALIFTSGTTGQPKAVPITNRSLMSVYRDCAYGFDPILNPESEVLLSYLPPAHVLGLIELLGVFAFGWELHFAPPKNDLSTWLRRVRPTMIFSTPRFFEKLYLTMIARSSENTIVKKLILKPSLNAMIKKPNKWNPMRGYVRSELKRSLGGRLKFAICGGAHLSTQIVDFFCGLGLPIYEGYGLTETSGPISANRPNAFKPGTMGKPFPEVNVRIALDGEILVKTEKLFTHYLGDPSATEAAFEEGWFKTGDLGFIDPDGFIHIFDRKKDILVTSGGKNIAPQKLENLLLEQSPMFSDAIVIGDKRPFISAILALNTERAALLGEELGLMVTDPKHLVKDPEFLRHVEGLINSANASLAPYEQIRRFIVLPYSFSLETGELTPTLKLKRFSIARKLSKEIDALYEDKTQ